MSFVDILIWGVLLIFIIKGFTKGLVREVCSLLGLMAGGWASFRYYHFVAETITPFIHLPLHIARGFSFLLILLVVGILFYLLGHLLTVVFKIMLLGGLNRVGGILFGVMEGALVLCVALYFGTARPVPEKVKGVILKSKTAQPFIETGRSVITGWDSAAIQEKKVH